MKYIRRPFGEGPPVSLFTLGTMRALASPETMYSVVKHAVGIGINHLETAPAYGPAESFLGESIKRLENEGIIPKDGWVITSKILPGVNLADGKKQIKAILSRLGKSKIANLAVHGLNLNDHLDWVVKGEGKELHQAGLSQL